MVDLSKPASTDAMTQHALLGYKSQCVVRVSTGELVAGVYKNTSPRELWIYISEDNGATWVRDDATTAISVNNLAKWGIEVDANDNITLAYGDSSSVTYIRTFTVSGDTISWVTATYAASSGNSYYQDHCVFSVGSNHYCALTVWDAVGERHVLWIASRTTGDWVSHSNFPFDASTSYCGSSIDFYHTGDGLTVQSSTPHLFIAFNVWGSGTALFKKYTYSGGAWTAETSRSIDGSIIADRVGASPCILFDGSDCWLGYPDDSGNYHKFATRNAADTTTTLKNTGFSNLTSYGSWEFPVGLSLDPASGDIIAFTLHSTGGDLYSNRWTGASWQGWNLEASAVSTTFYDFSVNRYRWPNWSTLLAVLKDHSTNFYVRSETAESFNESPTAPTVTSPTDGQVKDVAEVLPVVWTFNDPDPGDTQSAYSLRKQIGTGSYSYWNGSVFTASESAATKIASSGTTHTISSSWGADGDANHKYAIKTWDAADAGPSDWDEVYVTPSAQDNPTVTAITTVTAPTYSVTWTVATQTKYRVRVYDDSGGSPVTSTVFYDSGTLVSAVTSHSTPFPDNSVTRHVGVVTWNDEGLLSDEDTEQLAVSYLVPPTPTVSMSTTGSESGVIWVSINNPTPGGGETVTDSNEIYRRVAAEGGNGIRVAQGVAEDGGFNDYGPLSEVVYQYRARAVNAGLGTAAYGAWTT